MQKSLDTPSDIQAFRYLSLKGRLSLEMKGIKFKGSRTTYSLIKEEFNLQGNRQTVYNAYCAYLREIGVLKD